MNTFSDLAKNIYLAKKKNIFNFPIQNITLSGKEFINCLINMSIFFKRFHNLKKGSHVAILYSNSVEYILVAFYVILKKLILVPINPEFTAEEIKKLYHQSNSKILVTSRKDKKKVCLIKNIIFFDFKKELKKKNYSKAILFPKMNRFSNCLLLYTSGSTGLPKGSLLTHDNILSNAKIIASHHKINKYTKTLVLMPLFHNNGFVISLISSLLKTAEVFIFQANLIINNFWEIINNYKISYTSLMPAVLSMILASKKDHKVSPIEIVVACGGQKLSQGLLKQFEKSFNARIVEHYGLTETTSISTVNNLEKKKRNHNSVGIPIKGTKLMIYNSTKNIFLKSGYGEICIKGRNVFSGYYNNDKLNKEKFFKGFLKTGDYGRIGENKELYFSCRKDFLIIKGGENIYPAEIEKVIYEIDDVNECAVVGHKDNIYGEDVYAFVKFYKYSNKRRRLLDLHLKSKVAKFKLPKKVFYLGHKNIFINFPKTPSNKIKYGDLKKFLLDEKKYFNK
jgi:long-chain acyl-CoA synthetase